LDRVKEWTLDAAQHAAHASKMCLSTAALARAHRISAEAPSWAVEAVRKIGFVPQDAVHAFDRLMFADMYLPRAEDPAKLFAPRPYRISTSSSQPGRFSTSLGLLPSGGPMMPSRCMQSRMRAARP
jgi:hypothetical protein